MPAESPLNSAVWQRTLLDAALAAAEAHGGGHVIATDPTGGDMTFCQLLMRALILGRRLPLGGEKNIALLLPNANATPAVFLALHMRGRIPCMLNFSSGEANVLHACRIACVKTVITSRAFIEKGKLEHLTLALQKDHAIIYLEDLRAQVTLLDKAGGALLALFPRMALQKALAAAKPADPAVILYTSGSEGMPKGVALSHANILANIAQVQARLDLSSADTVFNALPVFHSFGLTVGMLLPLVMGVRSYLYPSPVHYKIIPGLVRKSGATIMLGTDTFYQGYARHAGPHDFAAVRLAVAGAEKLKETTRLHWLDALGVNILQGYGVTEASPVISVNTPSEHRPGTVGRLFPGIEARMEPVPGLEKGGRLFVKGPNIMLGYLKADRPGVIQPQGDWYDTGDIVDIDSEGYVSIQGRAKRFAKIAGEMVSLLAVEELASNLLPEVCHAALAVPDEKRGEQIVLITEARELTKDMLLKQAQAAGVAEICLPKEIVFMEAIPRLGSGKIDYQTLMKSRA